MAGVRNGVGLHVGNLQGGGMSGYGLQLAIYEIVLEGNAAYPSLTIYAVAGSIDDALRCINEFGEKYPWQGNRPSVVSIKRVYEPDIVLVSSKYLRDGEVGA